MANVKKDMFDFLSDYISKGDLYASSVIAKISMFIFKQRKEMEMSQSEFARFMGVTQGMVSKWESAEYNFTIESIAHISEKLKMSFDVVFVPESEYLAKSTQTKYGKLENKSSWGLPNTFDKTKIAA